MKNTSIDSSNSFATDRAWWFQKCSSFGWFQGSYPNNDPFFPSESLPIENLLNYCSEIYSTIPKGSKPNVEWTNTYYGGFNLQSSNILFTDGAMDPWARLSLQQNHPETPNLIASYYQAGHCAPMDKEYSNDPESLKQTRNLISTTLTSWLNEYYKNI